jgi:hypothetical protein
MLLAGLIDSLIKERDYGDLATMDSIDTCSRHEMSRLISSIVAKSTERTTLSTKVQAMYSASDRLGKSAGDRAGGTLDRDLLTEQCEICEADILFTSASKSRCQSGHQFSELA